MATDTTTSDTCSNNHSTDEESNASMTRSTTDLTKDDFNSDTASDEYSETPLIKSKIKDDSGSEENTPEFVVSDPIHIEVPHDDINSEEAAADDNSKSSLLDIHNIPILDDPPEKDDSSKIIEHTINICDGSNSDKSSNDDEDTTKDSLPNDSTIFVHNDNVLDNSSINLKPNSVVVLNPKNNHGDKQILSNDLLKGQRVFILNGNVISQEEAEKTKPDNINIICVSNNLNDIISNIKNDSMKTGCSVMCPESTDYGVVLKHMEKFITTQQSVVTTKNAPKFIQLMPSNYKQISPKINVATGTTSVVTIPKAIVSKSTSANKNHEILRMKLTGNEGTSFDQNQMIEAVSSAKKNNSLGAMKKDSELESPAVAKARSEFNKCRKKLIEAAIHPQLPTYKPPVTYEGPVFSCEECDDTFSSTDSLKNHKNRRSVLFTYNCPPCNCTLEFYNRCTFLLHVRSHDAAVKACYLTISTIPSDKLHFRLLQPDEIEIPIIQTFEKPIQRIRERATLRKSSEESSDSGIRAEINENGTDSSKTAPQKAEQNIPSRNFNVIKSLNRNKFQAYLKNTDNNKKFLEENSLEKKSDSESSLSDDTTDDENDTSSSREVAVIDTGSLNESGNTSQLKYFLTTNDHTSTPSATAFKRPIENGPQTAEETATKKHKVAEAPTIDVDTQRESVLPKIKHTPIIIRTKTSPTKPESSTDKATDEITLTSSDDEDDLEENTSTDDNKTVMCRECKVEVVNLNKHIRAENKPLKEFLCEHCKFFSPSKCALQAHIRMHSKAQPYICPDCGFYFNTYETFQTHVKQVCYYDYKAIRFECPECALLKPSVQAFADHLKRCHTRDVFKCSLCITSSYSTKVVDLHIKKKHVGEEGAVLEGYRCMLCPNILISKKSIGTHINKHVFSLKHLRYVYICKRCKKYASGKRNKFVHHLNECDDKKKEPVAKPIENVVVKPKEAKEVPKPAKPTSTKSTNTKPNRARPSKSPGKRDVVEVVVEKDPLSVEAWEADKLKAQFVPKTKICVMCRSADISSRSHSLFCNACVCSVNADDTASETSEGTRRDSGRPKRKFKCRLCKQFMNKDWATITKHYETDHFSDFKVRNETKSRQPKDKDKDKEKEKQPKDKDKDKDKDKEKEKEPDAKKTENITPINIIKKRRLSSKDTPTPSKTQKIEEKSTESEPELELEPHVPSRSTSGSYECFHCKLKIENRDEFRAHIVSHKTSTCTQCPECGQCFIVDATLAKHLLICHNVRNLRRYFFENDLFKFDEPIEKSKHIKDHQCDICLLQCDSKQSYDKHLRTHGMAFVALQSRSKGEKPRSGLVKI